MTCPFCDLPSERILLNNDVGMVVKDAYPVSPGHTLIIPHRHIGSFFELDSRERQRLFDLLEGAKDQLEAESQPEGYNIGVNDGPVAGQTVPHLHIHLIPRFKGDVPDPRGGIRWVIPEKAKYWS